MTVARQSYEEIKENIQENKRADIIKRRENIPNERKKLFKRNKQLNLNDQSSVSDRQKGENQTNTFIQKTEDILSSPEERKIEPSSLNRNREKKINMHVRTKPERLPQNNNQSISPPTLFDPKEKKHEKKEKTQLIRRHSK